MLFWPPTCLSPTYLLPPSHPLTHSLIPPLPLRTHPPTHAQVPLSDVDGQIVLYKGVQAEIVDKPSPVEVGWLRVNAQPVKSALITWVGHWIHKYIQHLQGQVITNVKSLNDFMHDVKEGTKKAVPEGDTDRLRYVGGRSV
jgi:hypothetical protein